MAEQSSPGDSISYDLTVAESCIRKVTQVLENGTVASSELPSKAEITIRVEATRGLVPGADTEGNLRIKIQGLTVRIETVPGNTGIITIASNGDGAFTLNGQSVELPLNTKSLVGVVLETEYTQTVGWRIKDCPKELTDAWQKLGIGNPVDVIGLSTAPLAFLTSESTIHIPLKLSVFSAPMNVLLPVQKTSNASKKLQLNSESKQLVSKALQTLSGRVSDDVQLLTSVNLLLTSASTIESGKMAFAIDGILAVQGDQKSGVDIQIKDYKCDVSISRIATSK